MWVKNRKVYHTKWGHFNPHLVLPPTTIYNTASAFWFVFHVSPPYMESLPYHLIGVCSCLSEELPSTSLRWDRQPRLETMFYIWISKQSVRSFSGIELKVSSPYSSSSWFLLSTEHPRQPWEHPFETPLTSCIEERALEAQDDNQVTVTCGAAERCPLSLDVRATIPRNRQGNLNVINLRLLRWWKPTVLSRWGHIISGVPAREREAQEKGGSSCKSKNLLCCEQRSQAVKCSEF